KEPLRAPRGRAADEPARGADGHHPSPGDRARRAGRADLHGQPVLDQLRDVLVQGLAEEGLAQLKRRAGEEPRPRRGAEGARVTVRLDHGKPREGDDEVEAPGDGRGTAHADIAN
ncbi:hypothetical protein BN1708_018053, partial [Verticillium longisporum]